MKRWEVVGEERRTTGHGESEKLVRIRNEKVPCDILVAEGYSPAGVLQLVVDHVLERLNLGIDDVPTP